MSVWDGIDKRVKVERWKIWILRLNEDHIWCVVPAEGQPSERMEFFLDF